MTVRTPIRSLAIAPLLVGIVLAGCSDSDDGDPPAPVEAPTESDPPDDGGGALDGDGDDGGGALDGDGDDGGGALDGDGDDGGGALDGSGDEDG